MRYFSQKKIHPNSQTETRVARSNKNGFYMKQKSKFIEAAVAAKFDREKVTTLVEGQGVADTGSY